MTRGGSPVGASARKGMFVMSGVQSGLLVAVRGARARPAIRSSAFPVGGSSGMIWPRSRSGDARPTPTSASARVLRKAEFARDGTPGPTVLMSDQFDGHRQED